MRLTEDKRRVDNECNDTLFVKTNVFFFMKFIDKKEDPKKKIKN